MPILDPDGVGKRTGIDGDFGDRALGPARIEYRFKSRPTGMMRCIGIRRRDMSADPPGPCLEVANTGGGADDADRISAGCAPSTSGPNRNKPSLGCSMRC
jgi:hypothetical protein